MSYDVYLKDPVTRETIELDSPHFMRGGTYALNGTTRLHFNITYNYSSILYRLFGEKGIRKLYGMTGLDSIPLLITAIDTLIDDDVNEAYWKCTEGNVKRVLISLLTMAKMRPDGIWDGD